MSVNPLAPSWLEHPAYANALAPTVWSQGAQRTDNGELAVAGVSVSALATEFGTPLYVMDEVDVRNRAQEIRESFEREFARVGSTAKVYYAGKAFLSAEVARWVTEAGLNIDVASGGELEVALAAGVPAERLGLHGNNKSLPEIDRAVSVGIGGIVIDSVVEIDRVSDAASRHGRIQPVRLRINSGVHASTHEYLATAREDQKFGIPLAEAAEVVARIRSHGSLRVPGAPLAHRFADLRVGRFRRSRPPLVRRARGAAEARPGSRAQSRRRIRHRVHEQRSRAAHR